MSQTITNDPEALISQINRLNEVETGKSLDAYLKHVAEIIKVALKADFILGFQLVPETGGVPRLLPFCLGPDAQLLAEVSLSDYITGIRQFIALWAVHTGRLYKHEDPLETQVVYPEIFERWMKVLQIETFLFLPLSQSTQKLAALIVGFQGQLSLSEAQLKYVRATLPHIGTGLIQYHQQERFAHLKLEQTALSHTFYNDIANRFRGRINALEHEIHLLFNQYGIKEHNRVTDHLDAAKESVYEAMRDLVIRGPEYLLVDLKQMTLYKALTIMCSALERAWLGNRHIRIEVEPIPSVIERQPLLLRRLLYTLAVELVGNAIKHGGPAPYTHIKVIRFQDSLIMQVIDHGKGFDAAHSAFSPWGLGFWRDLITTQLGGTFEISSIPYEGSGTTVTVHLPFIAHRRS